MTHFAKTLLGATALAAIVGGPAFAADVEVTHWWTSAGESAAVKVFADAFDATGNHWVDGAIGGSGDTARPIIISRIMGGNPPGATQFNPGKDSDDLVDAGLMTDLSDLAATEKWNDLVRPHSQMESCTRNGKVWCVPVNLHSGQWLWTNRHVYQDNGIEPPKNFDDVVNAAPALQAKGILPLSAAQGWPIGTLLGDIEVGVGGIDLYLKTHKDRDLAASGGPEEKAIWVAMDKARQIVDPNTIVPQWNDAVSLVITGKAAANVMGDWARGEFSVANMKAGVDYDCLPGLGYHEVLDTGGDVFYFPKQKDPEVVKAQLLLASTMFSKPVQVAFNLKKGSLPIRPDVDLAAADDCMKKGLKILENPANIFPTGAQIMDRDTINQIRDLQNEFFTNKDMTVDQALASFVDIIKNAPKG
ncbi:MAG: ABC transporter substrate-binding protein [Bauldia sp.]